MSIESWKDIEGYEGFYQVSNKGRVKSLPREVLDTRGFVRKLKGRILSLCPDSHGYIVVILQKNGDKKSTKVHQLVAKAFIPRSDGKDCVNHIDHCRENNDAMNLEWCTHQENTAHMLLHKRGGDLNGEKNGMAKLKEEDIIMIRELAKTQTLVSISKLFDVTDRTISKIVNRIRWKNI